MAEFKPIETQEQLNEVIGERLKRAEEKAEAAAAEKYADYDEIKKQNDELLNQLNEARKDLQTKDEAIIEKDKIIEESASYRTDLEKTKIALGAGLRIEYADRLRGETEEEWRVDAEALAKDFAAAHSTPPLGNSEPKIDKPSTKDQLQNWLNENF